MKKNLKKLLCLSFLLLGLCIISCETQEDVIEKHNHQQKFKLYKKGLGELMNDKKFNISFSKLPKSKKSITTSIVGRTIMEDEYGFTISEKPALVIEEGNKVSYTFLITRDSIIENSFENLVIQTDSLDNTRAVVIKYNLTSEVIQAPHNSFSFQYTTEVTPILYNNQQSLTSRITCTTINTLICCQNWSGGPGYCHTAVEDCVNFPDQGQYLSVETTTSCSDDGTDGGGITNPNPIDGGGSSGGGTNPINTNPNLPELEDGTISTPCKNAKPAIDRANNILHNSEVQQKMDAILKAKVNTNSTNEWGVAVGQTTNAITATAPKEGSATEGAIPVSQVVGTYIADGHTHPALNEASPSGADFYGMLTTIQNNNNFGIRYVYGTDNDGNTTVDVYALVVTDMQAAVNFLSQYPALQNLNAQSHSFYEDSTIGEKFYEARKKLNSGAVSNETGEYYSNEAGAFAYMMETMNAGISIAKVDANGNLKKIVATKEQVTPAFGSPTKGIKLTKCP